MKSIRKKRREVGHKSLFSRFVYLYRLIVINEDEQRRVFRMKISHLILMLFIVVTASLGAWGGIEIYRHSPKQKGTSLEDYRIRQAIVNEALRIDSLEQVFELQNRFITVLQDIIAGNVSIDTVYSIDSLARVRTELLMERTERRGYSSQPESECGIRAGWYCAYVNVYIRYGIHHLYSPSRRTDLRIQAL